ncbi:MAG: SRPBCC domain-containing protein [Chitinophagaceae bacterium]|nr:MAG: SRPBCC domain-containing protein [Chitinophagaceae bacterium]
MDTNNFNYVMEVDQTPSQVFNAVNNVKAWWLEDFRGSSARVGDEFEVRYGDVHYSRHRLTELVPDKRVVWLVTDSSLNFLQNKSEWNGTTQVFGITETGGKTRLEFTHIGLVPASECYNDCRKGWTQFLEQSLQKLITEGTGDAAVMVPEMEAKK